MLFDQREKSYIFFSLFSLISYLEKSRGRFREKWRVKSEKRKEKSTKKKPLTRLFFLELVIRIELMTSSLPMTCSTDWAIPAFVFLTTCTLYHIILDLSIPFFTFFKIFFVLFEITLDRHKAHIFKYRNDSIYLLFL